MKKETSQQVDVSFDKRSIVDEIDHESLVQSLLEEVGESLQPMSPEDGVDSYLRNRSDIRPRTKAEYRRKLEYFLTFAEKVDLENLNELSGREITEYRTWRREESSDLVDALAPKTMNDDMHLFRDFVAYLESIEAVKDGLSDKVNIPEVDDNSRDIELDPERLERILDYLEQFEYATFEHVIVLLLAKTSRRLGGIVGLDLGDYHQDETDPYLEFRHRPETPLKNGEDSEGRVSLPPVVNDVISAYIEMHRHDVEDEYGRKPLLTSRHGRPSTSTIRRVVYKLTRPCAIGESCPHGKSPDTCEAASSGDAASRCESSRSPHALRHGSLTELLRENVPTEVICDRGDLTPETLEKYYDERSEEEKRKHRREVLETIWQNGGGYL